MKLSTLATFWTASLLLFSGCATTPKPGEGTPVDKTLPVITFTQNSSIVDMRSVAFEWEPLKDPRVEAIAIYKSSANNGSNELKYYKSVKNRFSTHYVDTDVEPDTRYKYAFKTMSESQESLPSEVLTLNTLPVLASVTWIHSVSGMPRTAKLLWRPHANQRVKSYIVERKTLESDNWDTHAEIEGRLNVEFVDEDLKDQYTYLYRVKVRTFDNIISTPSEIVKVITKPLPPEVSNLSASRDLAKKIELHWNKSNAKDFARYYVYRSEDPQNGYTLLAKLHNNHFTDEVGKDGVAYYYRVSVVDKDGLESKYQEQSVQGLTLIKPNPPAVFEAQFLGNKIALRWSKADERAQSFVVSKRTKVGFFEETKKDYPGIAGKKFIDSDIAPEQTYYYQVYAVDSNGILSKPSIEVEVKTPALKDGAKPAPKTPVQQNYQQQEQPVVTPIKNNELIEM